MHESSERITLSLVWREILALVSLEKGTIRTTRDLAMRPGQTILSYLNGERSHLTNPLRYLIFTAATVAGLMVLAAAIGEGQVQTEPARQEEGEIAAKLEHVDQVLSEINDLAAAPTSTGNDKFDASLARQAQQIVRTSVAQRSMEIALTWTNVMLIVAMPIFACLTWIAFRFSQLNFAEHIVVNCYVLGFQNVLAIFFIVPGIFFGQLTLTTIYLIVSLVYQTWAWRRVFGLAGWRHNLLLAAVTMATMVAYIVVQAITTALLLWLSIVMN